MERIAVSVKGDTVNFDLFELKNQILQAPKNDSIKAREKFINKKKRKTTRAKINEMLADKKAAQIAALDVAVEPIKVDALPETNTPSPATEVAQALTERTTRKLIKRPKEQ